MYVTCMYMYVTYRSKIKRFQALFNIFRRIARSQNWTELHENPACNKTNTPLKYITKQYIALSFSQTL